MVDSCVLLDVLTEDPKWFSWSSEQITQAAENGFIIINPVIYSEISISFERIENIEAIFSDDVFVYRPISKEAAFLAGKCFLKYRQSGGNKSLPLPDFFIGAHASIESLPLITRDVKRFQTYYPTDLDIQVAESCLSLHEASINNDISATWISSGRTSLRTWCRGA